MVYEGPGNRDLLPRERFVIQVLAEVDVVLIIPRIGDFGHNVVPQLTLNSEAVLVGVRGIENPGGS